MGVYLNAKKASILFQEDFSLTYFVDKTDILDELVPILELKTNGSIKPASSMGRSPKYLCITRPRRFGKTVMANMIASFFGKGADSSGVFGCLKASGYEWYQRHLNQHNVIHIVFSEMPNNCQSYEQYISRIEKRLTIDLMKAYPDAEIEKEDDVWDALAKTIEYGSGDKFIFVLDEWDACTGKHTGVCLNLHET